MFPGIATAVNSRFGARGFSLAVRACFKSSIEANVFEIEGLLVDATNGRRDPIGEFTGLDDASSHEGLDESAVCVIGQPAVAAIVPGFLGEHFPVGADVMAGEIANGAVETLVGEGEEEGDAGFFDDAVPAVDAALNFTDIVVTETFIEGREGG